MAESDKPKSPVPGGEVSMERRMLLAFALVGLVLLLSQLLFSPKAPQNTGPKQTKPATAEQAKPPAQPPPSGAATAGTPVSAAAEQTITVETKVYRIVFSNRGGVVRSWQLKDYKDSNGKLLELVNAKAAEKPDVGYPLSYIFDNQKPSADLLQANFASSTTDGGLGISFDYSDRRTTAHKALRFARDSYLFDLTSEVKENGAGIPHMLAWRGGFGDRTAYAAGAGMKTLYF